MSKRKIFSCAIILERQKSFKYIIILYYHYYAKKGRIPSIHSMSYI